VLDYLRNYIEIAKAIKKIVTHYDSEAEVYVFGSVVKGQYTGASDIDILIISEKRDLEYKIKVEVYRKFPEAPLEIHFTSKEGFRKWYSKFIDSMIKV